MPPRRSARNSHTPQQDLVVGIPERQRTPYTRSSTSLASSVYNAGPEDHTPATYESVDEGLEEEPPNYDTVLEETVQRAQQEPQTNRFIPSEGESIPHPTVSSPPLPTPNPLPSSPPLPFEPDYYAHHLELSAQDPDIAPQPENGLSTPPRQPSRHWGQSRILRPNFQSMSAMIPPVLRLYVDIAFTPLSNQVGVPDEVRLTAREILKELVDMKSHEMRELRHEVRNRVAEERESRM